MKPQHTSTTWRLVTLIAVVLSTAPLASAASCDRVCLLQQAKQFSASMLAHTPDRLALAPKVQIRENTVAISFAQSRWMGVKQILSEGVYTDPVQGNVIEHVAAETTAGKPVYIGTRLKMQDGKITEFEINFDDSNRVNLKNLVPYDPLFDTLVPAEKRAPPREQLAAIITRYFQGLTDHAQYRPTMTPAATATTAATVSRTMPGTASSRAATSVAMRVILAPSPADPQPKHELP